MCKVGVFVLLFLCLSVHEIKCKRYRGGGRLPSSRPAPPSYQHHHTPPHSSGSGTTRPLGFDPPRDNPSHHYPATHTTRPIGFDPPSKASAPIEPPRHNAPVQSAPHGTGTGTVRPIGFDTSGHHASGSNHAAPLGNSPPYNHGQSPPPYNPAGYGPPPSYNPAGYGPPPPYSPAGYGHSGGQLHPPPGGYQPPGGYHAPGSYQPNYHNQGGGATIINNNINNHHYGGFGGGYGGYSPPVYTTHDTGSTALGFFLGYSLAKVTTPSFIQPNSYNTGPRYDHYSVHHYYHNNQDVPKEATIESNAIVACVGDSGSFCPANTTSLCTNNGAVMCVASATSTIPCSKEKQTNCVKSSVPCKDNKASECKESNQSTASIAIPCISTAKIYGRVSYINNSIVISNSTISNTSISTANNTTNNPNAENNTVTTTTEPITNVSTTDVTTIQSNVNVTTNSDMSTNVSASATNDTKEAPQTFCVTILALPAERKPSEGEIFISHSKSIFSKFAVKALGIE